MDRTVLAFAMPAIKPLASGPGRGRRPYRRSVCRAEGEVRVAATCGKVAANSRRRPQMCQTPHWAAYRRKAHMLIHARGALALVFAAACGKVEVVPASDAALSDVATDTSADLPTCTGSEANAPSATPICWRRECLRIGDSDPLRVCDVREKLYRCPASTNPTPNCGIGPYRTTFDGGTKLPQEMCCLE